MPFWDVVVPPIVSGLGDLLSSDGGGGGSRQERRQRKALILRELYQQGDTAAIADFMKRNKGFMKEVKAGKWDVELGLFRRGAPPVGTVAPQPVRWGAIPFRMPQLAPIGAALRRIPLGSLSKSLGPLSAAVGGVIMAREAVGPGHMGVLGPPLKAIPGRPDPLRSSAPSGSAARAAATAPRKPAAVAVPPAGQPPRVLPAPRNVGNQTSKPPVLPGGKPATPPPPQPAPAGSQPAPAVMGPPAPGRGATRVQERVAPSSSPRTAPAKPAPVPAPKSDPLWQTILKEVWPTFQTLLVDLGKSRPRERPDTVPPESPFAEPPGEPIPVPPGAYPFNAFEPRPLTRFEAKGADCACPKKPRKPRKQRNVCYSGTYIERANGLSKTKRRKVECRPSRKKRASPPAR